MKIKSPLLLILIGLGVGLLLIAQSRVKPPRVLNPVTPFVALLDTQKSLTKEQTDLKKEISKLREEITIVQENLKKEKLQSASLIKEIEKYKEEVGLTEVKGEGVVIRMDDSPSFPGTIEAITHAADLRDLVDFLWGEGAQAISINGERIIFSTSIDCIVNTILINTTRTINPFIIKVLGDPKTIEQSLKNENNLKEIHHRVKNEGLIFEVSRQTNLTIPSFNGSIKIEETKIF